MLLRFLPLLQLAGRAQARLFTLLVRASFSAIGPRSTLVPPVRLGGTDRIRIGRDVFIGPNSWLQAFTSSTEGGEPLLQIHDSSSLSGFCTITAAESVILERGVLVARYVYISDHTHRYDCRDQPVKEQGICGIQPVRICEGAWLGQSVVICPGVRIGRNAVIGANSVVTRDVPDFAVAAGAPARLIKHSDS